MVLVLDLQSKGQGLSLDWVSVLHSWTKDLTARLPLSANGLQQTFRKHNDLLGEGGFSWEGTFQRISNIPCIFILMKLK